MRYSTTQAPLVAGRFAAQATPQQKGEIRSLAVRALAKGAVERGFFLNLMSGTMAERELTRLKEIIQRADVRHRDFESRYGRQLKERSASRSISPQLALGVA